MKKIFVLFLCLAVLLAAACGNAKKSDNAADTAVLDETAKNEEMTTVEDTEEEKTTEEGTAEEDTAEEDVTEKETDEEIVTVSDEAALFAIQSYCFANNSDLYDMVLEETYPIYWEVSSNTDTETVVSYRSYTGSKTLFYISKPSGDVCVAEINPITSEEEKTGEKFNIFDFMIPEEMLSATWQTNSIVTEGENAGPEYYVKFHIGEKAEAEYGAYNNDEFTQEHSAKIVSAHKNDSGNYVINMASEEEKYSYLWCGDYIEYYETWEESEFADMYRGGASLTKAD